MQRDFEIIDGMYLAKPPHKLDLHNDFDFCGLRYSIEERILLLHWRRSNGDWVATNTPKTVKLEFCDVSEFRFHPRDARLPFSEDRCVHEIGYWTNEDWSKDQVVLEGNRTPPLTWLTAIRFMAGSMIMVQAAAAHAFIEA